MPEQHSVSRICLVVVLIMLPSLALAKTSGGTALPWESPLTTISTSLKGPVAYTISLLGVVAAGATLVFGGEINDFVRRIIMLVLVVSLLVFSTTVMDKLFPDAAGAVLTPDAQRAVLR